MNRTKIQNKKIERMLIQQENAEIIEETAKYVIIKHGDGTLLSHDSVNGLYYVKGFYWKLIDRRGNVCSIPCPYVAD